MNCKLIALSIAGFICLQIQAQNTIPAKTTFVPPIAAPQLPNVSAVTIVQDSVTSTLHTNGITSKTYHFKGIINSRGTGNINYKWVIITNGSTTIQPVYKTGSIVQGGTGTDHVFVEMGNGGNGLFKITLMILSPTQLSSNSITY